MKVEIVKQNQLDGRGGRLQGAEAEGKGAPQLEGGRQGGEASDKSTLKYYLDLVELYSSCR